MYQQFFIIFTIIIVHESGHLLIAKLFKWKGYKIKIYPYGGCVSFNQPLNSKIKEELLVLLGGPLFQMILFFIFYYLYQNNNITYKDFILIKTYNYTLLGFNLLPIYPLDGGKLFNLICNKIFNYKKGNKIVVLVSYLLVIILLFNYKNYNFSLMCILLLYEITLYFKNQNLLYNKFLLERYLNNYHFSKYKIISNFNKMYRDKRHIIKSNNNYITEKDYLEKRFNK